MSGSSDTLRWPCHYSLTTRNSKNSRDRGGHVHISGPVMVFTEEQKARRVYIFLPAYKLQLQHQTGLYVFNFKMIGRMDDWEFKLKIDSESMKQIQDATNYQIVHGIGQFMFYSLRKGQPNYRAMAEYIAHPNYTIEPKNNFPYIMYDGKRKPLSIDFNENEMIVKYESDSIPSVMVTMMKLDLRDDNITVNGNLNQLEEKDDKSSRVDIFWGPGKVILSVYFEKENDTTRLDQAVKFMSAFFIRREEALAKRDKTETQSAKRKESPPRGSVEKANQQTTGTNNKNKPGEHEDKTSKPKTKSSAYNWNDVYNIMKKPSSDPTASNQQGKHEPKDTSGDQQVSVSSECRSDLLSELKPEQLNMMILYCDWLCFSKKDEHQLGVDAEEDILNDSKQNEKSHNPVDDDMSKAETPKEDHKEEEMNKSETVIDITKDGTGGKIVVSVGPKFEVQDGTITISYEEAFHLKTYIEKFGVWRSTLTDKGFTFDKNELLILQAWLAETHTDIIIKTDSNSNSNKQDADASSSAGNKDSEMYDDLKID